MSSLAPKRPFYLGRKSSQWAANPASPRAGARSSPPKAQRCINLLIGRLNPIRSSKDVHIHKKFALSGR